MSHVQSYIFGPQENDEMVLGKGQVSIGPSIIVALLLSAAGCSQNSTFHHDLSNGPQSWNHTYFDDAEEKFTFAMFSDLTGGGRKGEKNFAAIEAALADRPYTVFNGHVQAYAYLQRHGRDYTQLATTGGEQFPKLGRSADHVTLVTVDKYGVSIANLLMESILDKTLHIPLDGEKLQFKKAKEKN